MDITIESLEFGTASRQSRRAKSISEALEDRWIVAASNGDDSAFSRLVELHQDQVFLFCCRWLQNNEDAREAAQDTFVRAYEAIPRYRRQGKFTTWLYRIALNLCRDHIRSKKSKQQKVTLSLDNKFDSPVCPRAQPDENAAQLDQQERLQSAVLNLPEKLRAAVILYAYEGLSQDECADILNCSIRAIEGRLYRARTLLKVEIRG